MGIIVSIIFFCLLGFIIARVVNKNTSGTGFFLAVLGALGCLLFGRKN